MISDFVFRIAVSSETSIAIPIGIHTPFVITDTSMCVLVLTSDACACQLFPADSVSFLIIQFGGSADSDFQREGGIKR